jgi:hypothetical protein
MGQVRRATAGDTRGAQGPGPANEFSAVRYSRIPYNLQRNTRDPAALAAFRRAGHWMTGNDCG